MESDFSVEEIKENIILLHKHKKLILKSTIRKDDMVEALRYLGRLDVSLIIWRQMLINKIWKNIVKFSVQPSRLDNQG